MTVLTATAPVSEAIYGLLQDSTLQAALGGRLYDDVPQDVILPAALFVIATERDIRGFGTGGLPEIEFRTHVFSQAFNQAEAQGLNQQIVALLKDAAISPTGYAQCGRIVYRETIPIPESQLNGVKVHEIVSNFTVWVEQS